MSRAELDVLNRDIVACRACPRLVEYRERIAREKRRAFRDWEYWGKPVPGFGDPDARVFVVGLAPAAHGGNRTGRVFTGDSSGDFLYRALFRAGFANQPTSKSRDDGLALRDCYVAAAARCAPPDNKPTPAEFARCKPFLEREFALLTSLRVVVALGKLAFDASLGVMDPHRRISPRPKFSHGAEWAVNERILLATYHPSQRNTSTKLLSEAMFEAIFARARELAERG